MKSFAIDVKEVNGHWQLFHAGTTSSANSVTVPAQEQGLFDYKIVSSSSVKFASDPIWIKDSTVKPTNKVVDSQIINLSGAGKTNLTFTDLNHNNPTILTYKLFFSDGSSTDPIINNGGGSSPPPPPPPPPPLSVSSASTNESSPQPTAVSYTNIAIYVGIGVIIGFIIAWLVKR
jgi:hypothetical protein